MIHANITYRLGKLFIYLCVSSTLFIKEKKKLKCIKIEFSLINQGMIKRNIENLPIDSLIIRKDTLIVPISLSNIYSLKDTYIELQVLSFKYYDCTINFNFDHQPFLLQELLQKPVDFNIEVTLNK